MKRRLHHAWLLATVTMAIPASPFVSLAAAQPAPRVSETSPAADLSALETLRKDVWVRWFAGDTTALRRVLSPELVAISPDGQQTLPESLAGAAQFKAGGGRLVSITFDNASIHRFGEVVVMFSHYTLVTEKSKKPSTQKGRATEVFVRRNGRWVHTSWHLDQTG